ncbi:MAG: UTP--glucose-1-phosphate uridylyltransferase GalU [Leptospirales bacterium]
MQMVRKAVFPLAGHGTRFLPMTKASPKEMLPIIDKPVVQYVLEEAVDSGIRQIVMVTGRGKRAIEDHFDISYELEDVLRKKNKLELLSELQRISSLSEIIYIRQKEALGLGHAVLCAETSVGEEPFAVALGDEIMDGEKSALAQLLDAFEEFQAPIIGMQKVPASEVSHYGIVAGHEVSNGLFRVDRLVEKPRIENAPSNYAIIGRYLLTPDVFPILRNQTPGVGGEIQLTDALNTLARSRPVYGLEIVGERFDTGDKMGFLKATVRFALKRPDLGPEFRRFLSEVMSRETPGNHDAILPENDYAAR